MDPNDPTPVVDNPIVDAPAPTDPPAAGDGTDGQSTTPTEPSKSTGKTGDGDNNTNTNKPEDTPVVLDSDLDDWITKRGLKVPETDAEKQSLQELRNQQREFTREQQAKKDAEELAKNTADANKPNQDDDEDDPAEKRLKALESRYENEKTTRLQSEFYTENKVTPEQHKQILAIMAEKFARPTTDEGKREAIKVWSNPDALPDLLDIAKARLDKAGSGTDVAEQAAQAERERIAKESQANSPSRNAKNTSPSSKTPDEERTERLKARYS